MSETKERELLPCPFCGSGNAQIFKGDIFYKVLCKVCGGMQNGHEISKKAIAAWNRRAAPAWTTEPTEEGLYWAHSKKIGKTFSAKVKKGVAVHGFLKNTIFRPPNLRKSPIVL